MTEAPRLSEQQAAADPCGPVNFVTAMQSCLDQRKRLCTLSESLNGADVIEASECDGTGGLFSGLLAEESTFDRRMLWRLGSWGAAAVGAVVVAVMANQAQPCLASPNQSRNINRKTHSHLNSGRLRG